MKLDCERNPRHFKRLVTVLVCLAGLCSPVWAQVAGGMLVGTVSDRSGGSIAGGVVSATNVETGVKRAAITNERGSYSLFNLLPGSYDVSVLASGFGVGARSGVTINVGSEVVVDFTLNVAGRQEQVNVTSEVDPLQLTTSELSGVASAHEIRELPLNGRSWTDLALLQPGVTAIETQPSFETGADRGTRGFGAQISVTGARPQQNNYRLDGISIDDYSNGAGSVLGGNLGAESIAEFSVITDNAPAEYGKTSGAVINAVTQSGTNSLHGDVYEFLRNSALDARNFFDGTNVPPFKRNQFGGALGGPIRKNRTFFFVNYEGIRQAKGVTSIATVPSEDARNGIIHNADGTVQHVSVDPAAARYLTFWSLPNAGLTPTGNGNIGFFDFAGQEVATEDFGLARVDHRFSDHDALFVSYVYDKNPYTYPDGLNDVLFLSNTARQFAAIEETHTFNSSLVNSFRAGLNREAANNNVPSEAINPAAADPSLAAVPGGNAAGVLISGLTPFTGGFGASGVLYHWTSYQANDDLSWTIGRHSLKIGVAVEEMRLNVFSLSNPSGQFSFGSLINFLTNVPSKFNAALPTAISPRALRETMTGAYIQDDWRLTRNFTINLGLRYEMSTVPTEDHGKLSALATPETATPHLGSPFFQNPTLANFEPRVGFAWDPFGQGKTVIRGAFGMYDVLPLPYEFILPVTSATPFTIMGTVSGKKLPPGTFYTGATPLLGPASLRATYVEQDPKRNYVMQWNFNIEQRLGWGLVGTAAYAGSRGVHLPYYSNQFDIVDPTLTSQGYLWPSPVGSGAVINPHFGSIRGLSWRGDSVYDAMQLGLRRNFTHGFQLQASFTWSKSIDDTSSSLAPDEFSNSVSTLPYFDPGRGRGLSDFNVGGLFVLNGTWQVPGAKTSSPALNWITGGWQLGGIFRASTGVPFSATWGSDGDPLGSNGIQDFPNVLTGPGCGTLTNPGNPLNYVKAQCFAVPTASAALYPSCDASYGVAPQCFNLLGNAGRNILIGPGLANLDFSVFKNIHIPLAGERFRIQFRTEFFNLLNHTNFGLPSSTDIFDSTGAPTGAAGLITSTSTSSREVQFGVKIGW